jgi:hypothetical protein
MMKRKMEGTEGWEGGWQEIKRRKEMRTKERKGREGTLSRGTNVQSGRRSKGRRKQ